MKVYLPLFILAVLLTFSCSKNKNPLLKVEDVDGAFQFKQGEQVLLAYQYKITYPPTGIDSIYGRSAYIHPLNAPYGQVLTRIQPEDHYHHYGIWNPWTHVLYDGDTLDFWNLKDGEGTIRFAGLIGKNTEDSSATIVVKEEHVVLLNGRNEVALIEQKNLTVSYLSEDSYTLDITINYTCATDKPFKILEYRYEGLGWRTTGEWDKSNSEVFTSKVDTRNEVDSTTDRWCVVQGQLGEDYGGAVMMSHPSNFNHPEPLRVWPAGEDNRGDLFASFSTTKNTDWLLEPGKTYTMKYRFLVYNGKITKEKAEAAWQNFATSVLN